MKRLTCRSEVGAATASKGKGKQAKHRRLTQEEVAPEMHMDFAFMVDEESEELLTILVAKERTTRMFVSVVVHAKSPAECAARKTLAFLLGIGCDHVAMDCQIR